MSKTDTTIQQLIDQLEALVTWFESDDVTVEEAVKKYETALQLSKEIETRLSTAKNQITVIKEKYSGD